MTIYVIIMAVLTSAILFNSNVKCGELVKTQNRKLVYVFLLLLLILIQGLRATSVGGDLYDNYAALYSACGSVEWSSLLNYSTIRGYEFGYILLNKICYVISSGNLQFFLFIVALIYMSAIGSLISRLSANRYVGLFFFFSSYMYNMSMNNIRSSLAISIICFGIPLLLEKKYFLFSVCIFAATFFHTTALVFLFFCGVCMISNKRILILIYALFVCMFTVGFSLFAKVINRFFPRYSNYFLVGSDGGYTFLFFLIVLALVIKICSNFNFWENHINIAMFKMFVCGIVLQLISLRIPYFSRAVYYHLISLPILMPALLVDNKIESKSKSLFFVVMIVCFWFYYLFFLRANNTLTVPYVFFFDSNGF